MSKSKSFIIKCRVYIEEYDKICEVVNIDFINNCFCVNIPEVENNKKIEGLKKLDYFTGYIDFEGNEIYTGDIIEPEDCGQEQFENDEYERAVVQYSTTELRIVVFFHSVYGGEGCCGYIKEQQLFSLLKNRWHKIGNIYQNDIYDIK